MVAEAWKQQRPSWCPHQDCGYRVSTQAVACLGELPVPADHDGTPNTHRFCMKGTPDDGDWLFKLELNRGDAAGLVRIFSSCFGFTATAEAQGRAKEREAVVAWLREGTAWHTAYDEQLLGLAAAAIERNDHGGGDA